MNIKIKHFFKNKSINLESLFSFILLVLIIITFFSSIILKNFGAKIDVPVIISFLSVCVSAGSFYVTNYENKRSDERKQAAAVSCWLLNSSKKDELNLLMKKIKMVDFILYLEEQSLKILLICHYMMFLFLV